MKKLFSTLLLACGVYMASAQVPANETVQIGQKAPELEFANPAGETLKLSEINKGRVVLIDFWASWCRPCRMANPKLVKLYDEYKDKKIKGAKKGFTILSVSLDQNKDAWVAAIDKDKLAWPYHMSDLGSWNSKAAELYGVQYIPQAFMVDAEGKIIGKYQFAEQAEADLQKMMKN